MGENNIDIKTAKKFFTSLKLPDGSPVKWLSWYNDAIKGIFNGKTRTAYISVARKN